MKQLVYTALKPTFQELWIRITNACTTMSPAMFYNAQQEVQSHIQMRSAAQKLHFENNT